jgi:hypothetical protein
MLDSHTALTCKPHFCRRVARAQRNTASKPSMPTWACPALRSGWFETCKNFRIPMRCWNSFCRSAQRRGCLNRPCWWGCKLTCRWGPLFLACKIYVHAHCVCVCVCVCSVCVYLHMCCPLLRSCVGGASVLVCSFCVCACVSVGACVCVCVVCVRAWGMLYVGECLLRLGIKWILSMLMVMIFCNVDVGGIDILDCRCWWRW